MGHEKKGAFYVFIKGAFKLGDGMEPEVYERTYDFYLPNVSDFWHYLELMHTGVNDKFNEVFINGKKIGKLDKSSGGWIYQSIIIPDKAGQHDVDTILHQGHNNLKITSRNRSGGVRGNIDDFAIRNLIIHYNYL